VRIEHALDRKPPQDLPGTADMIALWMGEHNGAQPADTKLSQLLRDTCFRRALVDEDGSLRDLQEHRVPLADIEERNPEA
jgi:hypothetical protein